MMFLGNFVYPDERWQYDTKDHEDERKRGRGDYSEQWAFDEGHHIRSDNECEGLEEYSKVL